MKRGALLILIIIILSIPILAQDEDGDGYCIAESAQCPAELDCNDNNPLIHPGADEGTVADGLDNDCNGIIDDITILCIDSDLDEYSIPTEEGADCGTVDCDDTRADINPGLTEICDDNIDNDCDGLIDSEDDDCVQSNCRMAYAATVWYNCTAPINTANDGDTVHMVLITQDCDENSNIMFNIYEYSDGQEPLLIEEGITPPDYVFLHIPDENGIPSNYDAIISVWNAMFIQDNDNTPEPEYYFEATVEEPNGLKHVFSSGTTEDKLLRVHACPEGNAQCGVECMLDIGLANETNETITSCNPSEIQIDCSSAIWSLCDPVTHKKSRDISQCTITGSTDASCIANAIASLQTEKSCIPNNIRPDTPVKGYCGDNICSNDEDEISCPEDCVTSVCGDNVCDKGEEDSCPDDCKKSSIGWIIFIIIIILAITGSIIGYYLKKKKFAKKTKQSPEEKKMPFASQKDLESVMNYIKAARARNMNDKQIHETLSKGGWKDEQIKFAFTELNKPKETATKKPKESKPAETPIEQQEAISPFTNKQDEAAIINYVKDTLSKGYPADKIKDVLLKSGRTKEQVDYAFRKANP